MTDRSQRAEKLFAWLSQCARDGEPCPSNMEIAARLGLGSSSHAVLLVQKLELQGLIRVHRFQCSRLVEIVATGARTREPKNPKPHWRARSVA